MISFIIYFKVSTPQHQVNMVQGSFQNTLLAHFPPVNVRIKGPILLSDFRLLIHPHKPHFQYSLALVNDFTYSCVLVFLLDSIEVQPLVNRPEVGKKGISEESMRSVSSRPCELGTLTVLH